LNSSPRSTKTIGEFLCASAKTPPPELKFCAVTRRANDRRKCSDRGLPGHERSSATSGAHGGVQPSRLSSDHRRDHALAVPRRRIVADNGFRLDERYRAPITRVSPDVERAFGLVLSELCG
jgi:hypothetical protein